MWTLFPPGNFWVFIIGAIVSTIIGTSILFRYKNNWLNYVHAALYFSCAALFVSEYALQQAGTYEQATIPHLLNGLFFYFYAIAGWLMNYWYINPLAKWKYKKQIDIFLAVGVLGIPILISLYFILTDQIFDLSNEKINGLWKFKIKDSIAAEFHNIHTHRVVPPIMMFSFFYGVVFAAKKWRRAIISLITFIGMAIGVAGFYDITMPGWHVSSTAFPVFISIGFFSWFVMDYKLDSSYDNALNDLLDSISDLVIQTDKNLKVNLTNAVLNSFFEQPEGSITAFLSKNSRYSGSEINGYLNRLTNQEVESDTLTLIDKKGKERQFQLKVSELDWRGKKKGYTFLLSDLSKIKSNEKELEALNSTKDQLFSVIAHDLRNPALAFKGITKRVNYLIKKKDFEVLNTLGDSMEKSAIKLNSLLDNLLKWTMTQRGSIQVKNQPVQIKALTQSLIDTFDIITSEKGIAVNDDKVKDNLVLDTDPELLETILRNLIDNAIKYSNTDSKILLSAAQSEEETLITVKDFGKGMTQEQVEKLFKVYIGKSTFGTLGEKGSGLGLNLVHDLVQRTGGELICQSESKVGTEMIIRYKS